MDAYSQVNYRVEVFKADGTAVWGQWVKPTGYGKRTERLTRIARDILSSEPRGSFAKVMGYVPYSKELPTEIIEVRQ